MCHAVVLPANVFEPNLASLLKTLALPIGTQTVSVDFVRVKYYIPAGVVAIMAAVKNWELRGIGVIFENVESCAALGYLQRMDFFSGLGLEIPENFIRHDTGGNFLPVREIVPGVEFPVNATAIEFGRCIAPSQTDARSLIEYASGELILNVMQHANGNGYVAAQYAPKYDMARIGVADCGIGLRESFRVSNSKHFTPDMSDADAITKALASEISSKTHQPDSPNRGVGLTMMRLLMEKSLGRMFIASGASWWYQDGTKPPETGTFQGGVSVPGTVCSAGFQRDQIHLFFEMMKEARIALGLQSAESLDNLFLP